jgi:glycerate 2-kinase
MVDSSTQSAPSRQPMPKPPPKDYSSDPRGFLRAVFDAGVAAVQPARCIAPVLPQPPGNRGRTIVLGGGKAAGAMAAAVEAHWTAPLSGLVVTRDGYGVATRAIEVVEAAHPVPDARGAAGAARVLDLARHATADDLVIALISGGASSLLAVPASGITLADKRDITRQLLKSGATINEINCVRKHLSAIKGGRLAAATPARVVTILISDVVGDDPSVIASGPTVPDPTTCADALAVLRTHDIAIGESVRTALLSGLLETPKQLFPPAEVILAARPKDALAAAGAAVRAAGLAVLDLGDACEGEAVAVATQHAELVGQIRAGRGPVCAPCVILSGGELTVRVRGNGRGGPNTEYVLALAAALNGLPGVWALAGDTDGMDGNSGAAGALCAPDTLARAQAAGLSVPAALSENDSAGVLDRLGDLLQTGPTMTNVNDLRAILVLPHG